VRTRYGLLDPNPAAGDVILHRNYGHRPGSILVNLRVAKTFGFGQAKEGGSRSSAPSPGGETRRNEGSPFSTGAVLQSMFGSTPTPRPYNLIISMSIRNVINHNNPGTIIGNITCHSSARQISLLAHEIWAVEDSRKQRTIVGSNFRSHILSRTRPLTDGAPRPEFGRIVLSIYEGISLTNRKALESRLANRCFRPLSHLSLGGAPVVC
jgi:hypothetical protein